MNNFLSVLVNDSQHNISHIFVWHGLLGVSIINVYYLPNPCLINQFCSKMFSYLTYFSFHHTHSNICEVNIINLCGLLHGMKYKSKNIFPLMQKKKIPVRQALDIVCKAVFQSTVIEFHMHNTPCNLQLSVSPSKLTNIYALNKMLSVQK